MFKRFTDCHKWNDPWFRRLPMTYKLLWSYLCDNCDNAGVWKIDFESASYFIGAEVDPIEALRALDGRLHVLSPAEWLIKKFVEFQFGSLNQSSPLHASVLKLIDKHTLALPYPKPRARVQVKDKVKDIVKVKDVGRGMGEPKGRPASPEEVQAYAASIGFKLDGQHFWDYQEARGWKLKTGPIRDWKAVVRTWKRNGFDQGGQHGTINRKSISEQAAERRRKEGSEGLRKEITAGSVFDRVRNLPEVQPET